MISRILEFAILFLICVMAFPPRLLTVLRFESVIHEYDPYFNYRSTQQLVKNGIYGFHDWFDERAWYPLGRDVGKTVYPGLMWSAALLHKITHYLGFPLDVRNACVLVSPLWASFVVIVTYFITKSVWNKRAGLIAAFLISVIPGYTARSVGGAFDNECISIFAMLFVFYFWIRAIQTGSMFYGALCSLAYFYMVAAWGGYVFIINLIPLSVIIMLLLGRYSVRLHVAYVTFFLLGVLLSMQIPFVSFMPVQSVEHLAAFGVFGLLNLVGALVFLKQAMTERFFRKFLIFSSISVLVLLLLGLIIGSTFFSEYITPWTGRFYSLLHPHAKSTIPLIISVSEHNPTPWQKFFQDLHVNCLVFMAAVFFSFQRMLAEKRAAALWETRQGQDGGRRGMSKTERERRERTDEEEGIAARLLADFDALFDCDIDACMADEGADADADADADAGTDTAVATGAGFGAGVGASRGAGTNTNTGRTESVSSRKTKDAKRNPEGDSSSSPFFSAFFSFSLTSLSSSSLSSSSLSSSFACSPLVTKNDGLLFVLVYAVASLYFSGLMVRLVLVVAPASCCLGAIALTAVLEHAVGEIKGFLHTHADTDMLSGGNASATKGPKTTSPPKSAAQAKAKTPDGSPSASQGWQVGSTNTGLAFQSVKSKLKEKSRKSPSNASTVYKTLLKFAVPVLVVLLLTRVLIIFGFHSLWVTSENYSGAGIIMPIFYNDGRMAIVDDYRESYLWLRHNTDVNARVMSWWDYGYQITSVANRTVIVDNNTWNNSHIATVGATLASNESDAYALLRYLDVDYVLVRFGGFYGYGHDDLTKFLWMVRIGNGDFPHIQERNYKSKRGVYRIDSEGGKAFHDSLMYKLCYYQFWNIRARAGQPPGYDVARKAVMGTGPYMLQYLEEAYTSTWGLHRIYRVKKPEELGLFEGKGNGK